MGKRRENQLWILLISGIYPLLLMHPTVPGAGCVRQTDGLTARFSRPFQHKSTCGSFIYWPFSCIWSVFQLYRSGMCYLFYHPLIFCRVGKATTGRKKQSQPLTATLTPQIQRAVGYPHWERGSVGSQEHYRRCSRSSSQRYHSDPILAQTTHGILHSGHHKQHAHAWPKRDTDWHCCLGAQSCLVSS